MLRQPYQVFIRNIDNNDIFELPFISLGFTEELNKGRDARVSMDFKAAKAIADVYNTDVLFLFTSGLRELWIQKNNIKVYIGVISDFFYFQKMGICPGRNKRVDFISSLLNDTTINIGELMFGNYRINIVVCHSKYP